MQVQSQQGLQQGTIHNLACPSASLSCPLPAVDQIVLKPISSSDAISSLPPAPSVVSTMQRLVEIVEQLRSPATAGTAISVLCSETLTPYVLEEAQDVLETLQRSNHPPALEDSPPNNSPLDNLATVLPETAFPSAQWMGQKYFRLSLLVPWLLWATVRSSDVVMQLMEGRVANCLYNGTWETGMLRLVPLFSLHTAEAVYTIDLATEQTGVEQLVSDRLLQFDSMLDEQPVTAGELLDRLHQQIQMTTPAIAPFLQGIAAELFIPQLPWQIGSIQLNYALEFTPLSLPGSLSSSQDSLPQLKFTDLTWREQYQTLIRQQQLTSRLSSHADLLPGQPLPTLTALVNHACQVSEQLKTDLTPVSRRFVTQELSFGELAARLHWCLIHSAYEAMQLLSGVQATVWMPRSACRAGTLRFLISLKIQTPESDWTLDLATGQVLAEPRSSLPNEAIVQSSDNPWCRQPVPVCALEKTLWQQVHHTLPEFKLLLDGTEIDLLNIDLLNNDRDWQPGVLQLQGNFEFDAHQ